MLWMTTNARYLSDAQAAYLLPQEQLTAESLLALLEQLNPDKIATLAINAKRLARPKATSDVADICLSLVKQQSESV